MRQIRYREADKDRMSRFVGLLFLTVMTFAVFLLIAAIGFENWKHIYFIGAVFAGLATAIVINTWVLKSAALHIFLTLCAIGFTGPTSISIAWYASHGFEISSVASDIGLALMLAVMIGMSIAEAWKADLADFRKELFKSGGLRKRGETAYDFRLRGTPKDGPYGYYFRPFRALAWFDIIFALIFAPLLVVFAPIALTQVGNDDPQREAQMFTIIFVGAGFLLRNVLTGAIVNWRLLYDLRKHPL